MTLLKNQFEDAQGEIWTIRVDTQTIIDVGQELGITVGELMDIKNCRLNIAGMVWIACRGLARARGITKEEFHKKHFTLAIFDKVMAALVEAIKDAFPTPEDTGGETDNVPLAIPETGNSGTSSS